MMYAGSGIGIVSVTVGVTRVYSIFSFQVVTSRLWRRVNFKRWKRVALHPALSTPLIQFDSRNQISVFALSFHKQAMLQLQSSRHRWQHCVASKQHRDRTRAAASHQGTSLIHEMHATEPIYRTCRCCTWHWPACPTDPACRLLCHALDRPQRASNMANTRFYSNTILPCIQQAAAWQSKRGGTACHSVLH
jgi:hypothetical protein